MMIELELPFPPSINHYWRHSLKGGGRVYVAKEGLAFQRLVKEAALAQLPRPFRTLLGPLFLSATVWRPDKRRRDLDNVQKALQDALAYAGIFRDDCQIEGYAFSWAREIVKGGRALVRIAGFEDAGLSGAENGRC